MRHSIQALAAGLTIALGGCGGGSNEFIAPPPPEVTVTTPDREAVTTYDEFTGRLDAVDTVELRARVRGFLETVNLKPSETQLVDRDDVLFVIEQEPYEAEVSSAVAVVDRAKAELDLAETTLERAQAAFEKDALTEIELKEREAQRDVKRAALKAAEAALVRAELDLAYTTIRSPVKGRASRELVDQGNLVGSGENTLLTTIVVDDPIYAYFNVSERQVLQYIDERPERKDPDERLRVNLQLADGTVYAHEGEVNYADNRIDPETGTLQARAVFPNEDGSLYPGLFCRVLLPRELGESLLVPELALQRDIVGPYLLVVDAQNEVARRDVELGPPIGRRRVVVSGLDGSERIVVNGLQRARPGITVSPVDQPAGGDEA